MNKYIFLHIAKAGGSTFRRILQDQYPPEKVYEISRISMEKSTEDFINMPSEKRAEIQILLGHMDFGLHHYMANNAQYLTMLRRPESRVVSNYFFIKRSPYHPYYDDLVKNKMSLKDYVESGLNTNINNGMIKNIVGVDTILPDQEEQMLEKAKQNVLDHFVFVGLMEKFDESLVLLKKELGWEKMPCYFKRKVNKEKINLTPEERQAIAKTNRLDHQFYEWAANRFDQLVADNDDLLARELPLLREMNQLQKEKYSFDTIYQKYKYPIQLIAKKVIPRNLIEKIWMG